MRPCTAVAQDGTRSGSASGTGPVMHANTLHVAGERLPASRRARQSRAVTTQQQVRTRHDEWGKRALSLWLKELGDVVLDARVAGESRRGDVLYTERRNHHADR